MRVRSVAIVIALASLFLGLPGPGPAHAALGTSDVQFEVKGTLPTFPCPTGCGVGFHGTGSGAGHASALNGSTVYDATFTILSGLVKGSASYTEPGIPFCPALGSASNPTEGSVTLNGGATGVVYRSSTPTLAGTVTNITYTFGFTYLRVGGTPIITISGGALTVSYFFPGSGAGSFTSPIAAGAGSGAFVVNAADAVARCITPGPLDFEIIGDAAIATL